MGMYEDDRIRHKNKLANQAAELLTYYRSQFMTNVDIQSLVELSDYSSDLKSTLLGILRKEQAASHNLD